MCNGHDIAWSKGRRRTLCGCGWMSPTHETVELALDDLARHVADVATGGDRTGPFGPYFDEMMTER